MPNLPPNMIPPSPAFRICPLAPLLLQKLAPYYPIILHTRQTSSQIHPIVVFDIRADCCQRLRLI